MVGACVPLSSLGVIEFVPVLPDDQGMCPGRLPLLIRRGGSGRGLMLWVWGLRLVVFGLGVVYAVSLLPGVRTSRGYVALLDGWANNLFTVGVVVLLVVRAGTYRQARAGWSFFAAAALLYVCGSLGYYLHYRYLDPIPYPSWSDAGWVAFYPLAYVALFLMLRDRVGLST